MNRAPNVVQASPQPTGTACGSLPRTRISQNYVRQKSPIRIGVGRREREHVVLYGHITSVSSRNITNQ